MSNKFISVSKIRNIFSTSTNCYNVSSLFIKLKQTTLYKSKKIVKTVELLLCRVLPHITKLPTEILKYAYTYQGVFTPVIFINSSSTFSHSYIMTDKSNTKSDDSQNITGSHYITINTITSLRNNTPYT